MEWMELRCAKRLTDAVMQRRPQTVALCADGSRRSHGAGERGAGSRVLPIGDVRIGFTVDPEQTSPHLNTPKGDSAVPAAAAAAPSSFGRYHVQRVVGSGGFGKVYLAHDTELDRPVAIKVLRSANVSRPEVDQFLEEGRRVARLRHPGIVTVHDIGTHDGQLYIVSDYLSGPSLAEWLIANRPTWLDAARIVAAIADALAHAHSKRTVHRDVKPVNIIFTAEQHPVLVDFGLGLDEARAGGQELGVVSGTPRYMAPEQVTGEAHRIDGRTDIYSLGVVLYEMLCGYVPFRGTDSQELLRQIRDDEPQPPRQLINDIPPALEEVCLRAMAKRMSDRYATAADLATALRQIAKTTVESGRQVSRFRRRSRAAAPLSPSPAAITPSSRRLKREAERRQVTVLACGCDLFASDLFLERLDAEDQARVLRAFQQTCERAVQRLDGVVVECNEHGVLACFGYPIAHEDAARRAAATSFRIVEDLETISRQLVVGHTIDIKPWIGLHTGPAVVEVHDDVVSLVGEARNIALRLGDLAEPGRVVCSEPTHRLIRGHFCLCEPRPAEAQGPFSTDRRLVRGRRRRNIAIRSRSRRRPA